MNDIERKKQILNMVNSIADNNVFWKKIKNMNTDDRGRVNDEKNIGKTNIRSLANMCNNADCYEELKLLINYKISKGNGWNADFDGQRSFGKVVLDDMEKIYELAGKNDGEAIRMIGLYFGYLYWEKCVIDSNAI